MNFEIKLLNTTEIEELKSNLSHNWQVVDGKKLQREFKFETFMDAIKFIDKVAEVSELLNHHALMLNNYDKVEIEVSTHKVGGLTKIDFVLAEKIDQIEEYDF